MNRKKKLAAAAAASMTVCLLLAGCEKSKGLETDELTITQYKGVEVSEVEKPEEVTDETVESNIQATLEAQAETNEITDRAVQNGDTVNLNYVGKIDGVEFDGGSAENYLLTIGSGSFIDGFEDSVIGHMPGETYDWNGKFPDDYGNADYAGKDVVFTITVNNISEQIVPELTDEFVKSVSEESETVEEYKKEVEKNLKESNEVTYKNSLQSAVWQAVLDNTEVTKYPQDEVDEVKGQLIDQYESMAEANQMELDDLLQNQFGMSREDFESQAEEAAKSSIKERMVMNAIADKEKISLSDEEYEKELQNIADMYGIEDVETLKGMAEEDDLKDMALLNKVLEWLTDNCVQKAE